MPPPDDDITLHITPVLLDNFAVLFETVLRDRVLHVRSAAAAPDASSSTKLAVTAPLISYHAIRLNRSLYNKFCSYVVEQLRNGADRTITLHGLQLLFRQWTSTTSLKEALARNPAAMIFDAAMNSIPDDDLAFIIPELNREARMS